MARKAEGLTGPQRSGMDMRAVCEDRGSQPGHLHEGDVQHHQGAVSGSALCCCEVGIEGQWRTDVAESPGRGPEVQQLRV